MPTALLVYGWVYGVFDKRTKRYVYAGQSIKDIRIRFSEHKRDKTPLGRALRRWPRRYEVVELDTAQCRDELDVKEKRWVKDLGTLRFFNIRLGGHRGKLRTKGQLAHRVRRKEKVTRTEREYPLVTEYEVDIPDIDPDVLKENSILYEVTP